MPQSLANGLYKCTAERLKKPIYIKVRSNHYQVIDFETGVKSHKKCHVSLIKSDIDIKRIDH